ncbi:MAG: hydroxyethylthiazole kinase [Terriglobales bacterium]
MNNIASRAVEIMAKVRSNKPLVHQITNFVVMNETANSTLCAGALPVMAHARQEVEEMAGAAHALVLNLGTLWPEQVDAMLLAGRRANVRGIPVVLDPVGAGATRFRTESAHRVLDRLSVAIVRGNLAEVATLAGYQAKISGVEASGASGDPAEVAGACARKFGCVAAITGSVDTVSDGTRLARVSNGHELMSRVTGTGCMSTAVTAAYAAVESDPLVAAASALAAFGLAGEIAAQGAPGPGTFHVRLYDALAQMTAEALRAGARIEIA